MTRMCIENHALHILLTSGLLLLSGCKVQEYKNLQIIVDSYPSGADVYGVDGPLLGEFIGRTPLVLIYVKKERAILGPFPEQTIEYAGAYLAFKCYIKKQGYGTYRIFEIIDEASEDAEGCLNPPKFGRRVSYTAGLYPLRSQNRSETSKDGP